MATYHGQVPNILDSDYLEEEEPFEEDEDHLEQEDQSLNRIKDYQEDTKWTLGVDVSGRENRKTKIELWKSELFFLFQESAAIQRHAMNITNLVKSQTSLVFFVFTSRYGDGSLTCIGLPSSCCEYPWISFSIYYS